MLSGHDVKLMGEQSVRIPKKNNFAIGGWEGGTRNRQVCTVLLARHAKVPSMDDVKAGDLFYSCSKETMIHKSSRASRVDRGTICMLI